MKIQIFDALQKFYSEYKTKLNTELSNASKNTYSHVVSNYVKITNLTCVDDITSDSIKLYACHLEDDLINNKLKRSSCYRNICLLKTFVNWLYSIGYIDKKIIVPRFFLAIKKQIKEKRKHIVKTIDNTAENNSSQKYNKVLTEIIELILSYKELGEKEKTDLIKKLVN
ncbi:MAG: hypothetical protein ABH817_01340 [archaeon]